jgi:hypothetical protein
MVLSGKLAVSAVSLAYRLQVETEIRRRHDAGEITDDTFNNIKW